MLIRDIACGRRKCPGAVGIDLSAAGLADVLCDWTKRRFRRDIRSDQIRMIHIIEEGDDIFRILGEAHPEAMLGAMATIVAPHYPDHTSYCNPSQRWHLSSFPCWFFADGRACTIPTCWRFSPSGACTSSCCAFGAVPVSSFSPTGFGGSANSGSTVSALSPVEGPLNGSSRS
jgi:hypothetical protein